MRSFIALAAAAAALAGYPALAEEGAGQKTPKHAPPFAEDGIYVPAGETVEVAIAGKCHRFTNHDTKMGFFFSPSQPGSWPDEDARASVEPKVTEAACR